MHDKSSPDIYVVVRVTLDQFRPLYTGVNIAYLFGCNYAFRCFVLTNKIQECANFNSLNENRSKILLVFKIAIISKCTSIQLHKVIISVLSLHTDLKLSR